MKVEELRQKLVAIGEFGRVEDLDSIVDFVDNRKLVTEKVTRFIHDTGEKKECVFEIADMQTPAISDTIRLLEKSYGSGTIFATIAVRHVLR